MNYELAQVSGEVKTSGTPYYTHPVYLVNSNWSPAVTAADVYSACLTIFEIEAHFSPLKKAIKDFNKHSESKFESLIH